MLKIIAVALLSVTAFSAAAQSVTDVQSNRTQSGYARDARGNVLRSSTGLCWRSGFWNEGDAIDGCDGALVPPITQPTAPDLLPAGAQSPIAPPIVVPSPTPRCDSAIVLASDATFGFGSAVLRPPAKARLDLELRQRLASCDKLRMIKITGHTDRIGSVRANLLLSKRRAEAIASAVRQAGLSVPIEVRGLGAKSPLVICPGQRATARLISCLAPNRRATIEFDGTTTANP